MKKRFIRFLSAVIVLSVSLGVYFCVPAVAAAKTEAELNQSISQLQNEQNKLKSEINSLKQDKAKQEELKAAIEKQMALVQKEIDLCNQQINSINSKIAANKAEIEKKNAEIEADKLAFKKRLRAIYMSSSDSNVQILLGAEDFSQFLQLYQLTASVSARDKLMIEKIVKAVETLEAKQAENNKLLEEQKGVKATITAKQNELKSQSNEIQSLISQINSEQSAAQSQIDKNSALIKEMQNDLDEIRRSANNSNTSVVYDGGQFLWPVPSITKISSYYGYRWDSMHNGIDISNGTYGAKIVAIADGVVTRSINNCSHNYPKNGDCCGVPGQGKGYGNHVVIDHGRGSDGKTYAAYYAHMSSVAVSAGQTVKKGQTIGYVGCTGYSTGPHLHFGLIVNGSWVDPMRYYSSTK
ncbi:MAG: murein hydrolase activator EnvC family protein [Acutalibacteraceae bacterium]